MNMTIRIFSLLMCLVAGAALAAETAAPAARIITLVRHGHYAPDPAASKELGPGLTALGVAQAHLVGARLAGKPQAFDGLFVSPLQRARDTAATLGADFPGRQFEVVDDLEECTPPTRRADIMADEKPEDLSACKAQLDRVFARFFKPSEGKAESDLLVCHGNVIRYLVTRALAVDSTSWLVMSIGHASITTLLVEADGSVRVIAVGDVGHLPPNMLTGSIGDPERSLAVPSTP